MHADAPLFFFFCYIQMEELYEKTEDILNKESDEIRKEENNLALMFAGLGFCAACTGPKNFGLRKEYRALGCLGCAGVLGKGLINHMYSREKELQNRSAELSKNYEDVRKLKTIKAKKRGFVHDRVKMFDGAAPQFVSHRGKGF